MTVDLYPILPARTNQTYNHFINRYGRRSFMCSLPATCSVVYSANPVVLLPKTATVTLNAAQIEKLNWPMSEQQIEHRKSYSVLSAHVRVIIWCWVVLAKSKPGALAFAGFSYCLNLLEKPDFRSSMRKCFFLWEFLGPIHIFSRTRSLYSAHILYKAGVDKAVIVFHLFLYSVSS